MTSYASTKPLPIAVLISGQGSNLQAIIDAIANGLPAKIVVVISDQPRAYGLVRAQQANVPTELVLANDYPDRINYDQALLACLKKYSPELIILAGFMRILGKQVVQYYQHRIFNIHPALLPKYPGLNTYQKVLANKDPIHGSTVHVVTDTLDGGPIIAYADCPVTTTDTEQSLKAKVQVLEHQLYPEVIKLYAQGRLQITANAIELDGKLLPPTGFRFVLANKQH